MNAWNSSTVRRNAWSDFSCVVLTRTMHSVSVETTARGAAHFLSTEQSCQTPSKAFEQPYEGAQILERSDCLLGLDPPDVLDQVLERVDQEQTDLVPEEALQRARLLKAVPQSTAACPTSGRSGVSRDAPRGPAGRGDAQRVHEIVDAHRDDVAVFPARHRDAEVPLLVLVGAEDGTVCSENASSERNL